MTHEAAGASFDGFTQPFGAINIGDGAQVLPRPEIPNDYNSTTRSYEDLTFYWQNSFANMIETTTGVVYTGAVDLTGYEGVPISAESAASYILQITQILVKKTGMIILNPLLLTSSLSLIRCLSNMTTL